ncbi:hypothetical protein QU577_13190 [Priestia megaterium]|uniref:hypothetical protein n=1 Tax=Priestia megaterium TaxID=1404 RepID=UPI0025B062C7|nr:hypothetical protein [Priestia megaterium]MDN3362710.1 hypothetical protein [Priestia megaterium]
MKVQPAKCGVYVLSGLGAVMVFFLLLLKNSAFFLEEEYNQNKPEAALAVNEHTYHLHKGSINWSNGRSTTKKEINVYDLYTYISQQKSIPLKQQQSVKLHFSNLDGAYIRGVNVHIWKNNGEKTKLFVKNNEFKIPKNQGFYVVDIVINSTRGTMQYAANVQIQ